jgi:hypothetical protein
LLLPISVTAPISVSSTFKGPLVQYEPDGAEVVGLLDDPVQTALAELNVPDDPQVRVKDPDDRV